MGEFKKSTNIQGTYKAIEIVNGKFCDPETGEVIDVIGQLSSIYGENVFKLTTACKTDVEMDPDEE